MVSITARVKSFAFVALIGSGVVGTGLGVAFAQVKPAVVIQMTDQLKYEPSNVTVKKGQTIKWKNGSSMVHTVTADPKLAKDKSHVQLPPKAAPFNSSDIAPNQEYQLTPTVPGHYKYFCIPHEGAGMVGEFTVE